MIQSFLRALIALVVKLGGSFVSGPTSPVPMRLRPETPTARLLRMGLSIAGGTDTEVLTGSALTVKAWSDEIWLELPEQIFFAKYMQEDMNAIIEVKKELDGKPGDLINFYLQRQLSGAGVTGDSALEGSEEEMQFYADDVTLDQFRNAVRLKGRLSERRTAFNQRRTAKQALKDWLANKIDSDIFTALSTSPSTGRTVYGGLASSTATLAAGDLMNLALLSKAKTIARKATPQIFPVKVEGGDYFLFVCAPDVLYNIKINDPTWSQAQREAKDRGKDNDLFTGAEGIWDGVVIRSCTRVALTTTWGAGGNVTGAENLLLGRQAGCFAWGEKPQWVEQSFDYANKIGFAIGAIYAVTKAVFNSVDNGAITVRVARTSIS